MSQSVQILWVLSFRDFAIALEIATFKVSSLLAFFAFEPTVCFGRKKTADRPIAEANERASEIWRVLCIISEMHELVLNPYPKSYERTWRSSSSLSSSE